MAKKNTFKDIKAGIPELESEKVEVIADTLDSVLAMKRLWSSNDGKELLEVLKHNCAVSLRKATMAAEAGDKDLLLAVVLKYAANMDLLATLQDISSEAELRTQLDEAVKEAMGR